MLVHNPFGTQTTVFEEGDYALVLSLGPDHHVQADFLRSQDLLEQAGPPGDGPKIAIEGLLGLLNLDDSQFGG